MTLCKKGGTEKIKIVWIKMALVSQDKGGCIESGNTNWKKINQGNCYFSEIHRCPEGAKIGFKQLIVEFGDLIVPHWVVGH